MGRRAASYLHRFEKQIRGHELGKTKAAKRRPEAEEEEEEEA